jgi:hypothetical protein
MAHHLDDDKLESEQYSKGLVHFFEYLLSAQAMWDKEFDDDLYEEGIDEPRPEWDVFPRMTKNMALCGVYIHTKSALNASQRCK